MTRKNISQSLAWKVRAEAMRVKRRAPACRIFRSTNAQHTLSIVMADPFTAIGTTAALIELIKVSWKIVNTAHSCYVSETEAPVEDETLEGIICAMHRSLANLHVPTQPSAAGDFSGLITRSKAISQEILEILEKSKIERAQSLSASIKVALKNIWTKEKISKLRSGPDSILTQLSVHLQLLAR